MITMSLDFTALLIFVSNQSEEKSLRLYLRHVRVQKRPSFPFFPSKIYNAH